MNGYPFSMVFCGKYHLLSFNSHYYDCCNQNEWLIWAIWPNNVPNLYLKMCSTFAIIWSSRFILLEMCVSFSLPFVNEWKMCVKILLPNKREKDTNGKKHIKNDLTKAREKRERDDVDGGQCVKWTKGTVHVTKYLIRYYRYFAHFNMESLLNFLVYLSRSVRLSSSSFALDGIEYAANVQDVLGFCATRYMSSSCVSKSVFYTRLTRFFMVARAQKKNWNNRPVDIRTLDKRCAGTQRLDFVLFG